MKKKQTKKEPLVFTPEIRAYFREREVKRMEKFKKEIIELRQRADSLKSQRAKEFNEIQRLRKEIGEFYKKAFNL